MASFSHSRNDTLREYKLSVREEEVRDSPTIKKTKTRRAQIRGKTGEHVMQYNFKKVAKFGLGLRWARMGNEMVGEYTGRRMRQEQNQARMLMMQYAVGVKIAGPFGLAYAGMDMGYRAINHQMRTTRANDKAEILRRKSGNSSRLRGRSVGIRL